MRQKKTKEGSNGLQSKKQRNNEDAEIDGSKLVSKKGNVKDRKNTDIDERNKVNKINKINEKDKKKKEKDNILQLKDNDKD